MAETHCKPLKGLSPSRAGIGRGFCCFCKVIQQPGVWNAGICVRMPMIPHQQCWQQALMVLLPAGASSASPLHQLCFFFLIF